MKPTNTPVNYGSEYSNLSHSLELLIPGLPFDLGYKCLLRVPLLYHAQLRSVCKSWYDVLGTTQFYNDRVSEKLDEHCLYAYARDSKYNSFWYAFDTYVKKWFRLPSMPSNAHSRAVGQQCKSVGGKLIVCGGWQGKPLNDVMIFDPKTNFWRRAAPMHTCRAHFVSGVIQGCLYVAGGNDGCQPRSRSAECYDPHENKWHLLPFCENGLSFCTGLTLDDKLFIKARGGVPKGIQAFWPEMNAWSEIESHMIDQPTWQHVVLQDQLYRLEASAKGYILEKYELENDKWTYLRYLGNLFKGQQKVQDIVSYRDKICIISENFSVALIDHNGNMHMLYEQSVSVQDKLDGKVVNCHVLHA